MTSGALFVVPPDKRLHAEEIFDLLAMQWRNDLREHCRNGRIHYSHYDWSTSRVAVVDGKTVTHFGVYDLTMRVGSARVHTAGVNLVVTHPDYRKRGLMPRTIEASMEAMQENGYDLSIICNAVERYYDRFGYIVAWPETHYYVSTDDLPTAWPTVRLRKFNTRHRAEMADLYNRENEHVTGTVVRPTFLRTKEPGELQGYLMLDDGGAIVGYVIYDVINRDTVLWHSDSAGDPEQRLRVLGQIARKLKLDEVRFNRQPHSSELARCLRRLNCYTETKYTPTGGWMVRIINLHTLFEKLAPELSLRLKRSYLTDRQTNLLISTGREAITLELDRGKVRVGPPEDSAHAIEGGEEIALLVLGTDSPLETVAAKGTCVRGDAPELMQALFPRQYPQMGNADL